MGIPPNPKPQIQSTLNSKAWTWYPHLAVRSPSLGLDFKTSKPVSYHGVREVKGLVALVTVTAIDIVMGVVKVLLAVVIVTAIVHSNSTGIQRLYARCTGQGFWAESRPYNIFRKVPLTTSLIAD